MTKDTPRVLAINGGSSSIKFVLYHVRGVPTRVLHGKIDRVGLRGTTLTFDDHKRSQQDRRVIGDLDLQAVCFDTAFHRDLPRVAKILAIPRRFEAQGVLRFGFHGLSYSYLRQRSSSRW